jgi:hypothetical protein
MRSGIQQQFNGYFTMTPEAGDVPLAAPGIMARKTWRRASIGRRTNRS